MKKALLLVGFLVSMMVQGQKLEDKVIALAKADNAYNHTMQARVIKAVSIQESIDNFYRDIEADKVELPEAIEKTTAVINEAKAGNDQETFKVWSFKKERLQKFMAATDTKAIDYRIVEHTYSEKNPKPGYSPITVTAYYFFDGQDNFIGKIGQQDFTAAKQKYSNSVTHPFEFIMFGFRYKDTLGR